MMISNRTRIPFISQHRSEVNNVALKIFLAHVAYLEYHKHLLVALYYILRGNVITIDTTMKKRYRNNEWAPSYDEKKTSITLAMYYFLVTLYFGNATHVTGYFYAHPSLTGGFP